MRCIVTGLAAVVTLSVLASACSSSKEAPDDTCGFIADPNNCYRQLLATVEACLTDTGGDAGSLTSGTLAADGLSCTYASGRTVTFGTDARTWKSGETPMDVTVALRGKTCVHYASQPKSSFSMTGPNGEKLDVSVAGFGETITCPGGSTHGIDATKLFGGCGDAGSNLFGGGLPGTSTATSGTRVSGSLVGMKGEAYDCAPP